MAFFRKFVKKKGTKRRTGEPYSKILKRKKAPREKEKQVSSSWAKGRTDKKKSQRT